MATNTTYIDSAGVVRETTFPDGGNGAATTQIVERDAQGNVVPTQNGHSYSYDTSGNLVNDTVSDANGTWVRTYTYTNGVLATDSGWVKQ